MINKRIMISLAAIFVAGTAAVGGTIAQLTSTASITGVTFTSANMDLKIDSNPAADEDYVWSSSFPAPQTPFARVRPGISGQQVIDLINTGAAEDFVDGSLALKFSRTSEWNELSNSLNLEITFDADRDGDFDDMAPVAGTFGALNNTSINLGQIAGATGTFGGIYGKMASVKIAWSIPANAGNEIKGDSLAFNAIFDLTQN